MKGIKIILLAAALLCAVVEQQSKAEAFQENLQLEEQLSPLEMQAVYVAEQPVQFVYQALQSVTFQLDLQMELMASPVMTAEPWTKIPSYPTIECREREAYIRESIHPPLPIITVNNNLKEQYHGIRTRQ